MPRHILYHKTKYVIWFSVSYQGLQCCETASNMFNIKELKQKLKSLGKLSQDVHVSCIKHAAHRFVTGGSSSIPNGCTTE